MHVVDDEKVAQVIHIQLLEQDLQTKGKIYYKRKDPQRAIVRNNVYLMYIS
jgi:hypothetical protein